MKYKIVALASPKLYNAMQNWYFRTVCRAISMSQKALVLQIPPLPLSCLLVKTVTATTTVFPGIVSAETILF